jgi:peroxiredoxin
MKPLILSLLLATPSLALAAPQVGQPAPDFAVRDSQGQTRTLAEFAGRTLVLEWSNHDCPFVQKHYGGDNMQALQRRFTEQGVAWLTVISSAPDSQGHVSPQQADELSTRRNAAPSAVLLDEDGRMGRAYEAKVTPHMYVIDPQGILQYMGGIDSIRSSDPADIPKATPYLAEAVEAVLAGRPAPNPVTRAYGCSVKYLDGT